MSSKRSWSAAALSDLVIRPVTYGVVKPGAEGPVSLIRATDLQDGRIMLSQLRTIGTSVDEAYARTRVRADDLLVGLVGNPGEVALVPAFLAGANVNRAVGIIRLDQTRILPRFAYYYLRGPGRQFVLNEVVGSVQQVVNLRDLARVHVVVPALREQAGIVAVLGALDDKIDSNRRLARLLDELASTLFRSWFVDFDPVHTKEEGRQPVGIGADTTALFPNRFEDSPIGPVPAGWEASAIGAEVRVVGGGTPSTKEPGFWEGGDQPWATPKDLAPLRTRALLATGRCLTEAGVGRISSGVLPTGTVLLSSRAPIGYVALAEVPIAINQGFIAMVCDKRLPNHYVLGWTIANVEAFKASANGTTFLEISKKSFRPLPIVVPPEPILTRYQELASVLHARVVAAERESQTLSELRDLLLPELISGRLCVKDLPAEITDISADEAQELAERS